MIHPASALALGLAAAVLAFTWIRRVPVVLAVTVANFLVFVLIVATGARFSIAGSPLLDDLATRVDYLVGPDWVHLATIVSSTFLHANLAHIVGNMLVLVMLGLPFEERVGRWRFAAIYFGSAVVAVVLHAVWILYNGTPADRALPLVGASGAVFGILGAFAATYPRDQIPMFLVFILLPRVPVFLGAIVMTFVESVALFGAAASNVAHAAHIGGAVGGVLFGLLLKPRGAPADGRGGPHRLDYAALERLAQTPQQRGLLERLRENEDHPDTQAAWLDRLVATLQCPRCGAPYGPRGRGSIVCQNGHEERYVA